MPRALRAHHSPLPPQALGSGWVCGTHTPKSKDEHRSEKAVELCRVLLPSRTSPAFQAPPEEHCPSWSRAALPRGALPCPLELSLHPLPNREHPKVWALPQKCRCLKVPLTPSRSRTQTSHSHFRVNHFFFSLAFPLGPPFTAG